VVDIFVQQNTLFVDFALQLRCAQVSQNIDSFHDGEPMQIPQESVRVDNRSDTDVWIYLIRLVERFTASYRKLK
jgi:hypothetical protein